jgi:hypothetical protein
MNWQYSSLTVFFVNKQRFVTFLNYLAWGLRTSYLLDVEVISISEPASAYQHISKQEKRRLWPQRCRNKTEWFEQWWVPWMLIDLHATCTVMNSYKNHPHLTSLVADSRWSLMPFLDRLSFSHKMSVLLGRLSNDQTVLSVLKR